ncbi:MAG: ABC transporter substrate-binding protein [SAR324 cluster bacterium]|uniref:ABC transporter substrate-binding protein n=1 Tax=SAR324 cluster bacterium TaxID=2024889 RepID=A0A2D6YNF0_9DELT|nr:ABC transporter substrate-binding protein [SAR324 cluster bacterium]
MMKKFLTIVVTLTAFVAAPMMSFAACDYRPSSKVSLLANSFAAWKAVSDAMGECGNFEAELDAEFRKKQPDAFAANPSLYQLGGVSNGTIQPLLSAGTIRPLDDLVAKYGKDLQPNQLIRINGQVMAIAMMVNNQHLMYREDIFKSLGLEVPTTYFELLSAADKVAASGQVQYALGGTYKAGWNLAEEFVNMYIGMGGDFFDGSKPNLNNAMGVRTLEMMRNLTHYMDPEYLVADSTYVQQQFQQGKIAMAVLWATRAAAMDDAKESQVVGKVKMAAAPSPVSGALPASTLWWDGVVLAKNMTDQQADEAFQLLMEGIDREMVTSNNDAAVWLINGYKPGPVAMGAAETAENGALPYPNGVEMGLMHTALGNNVADFLTGKETAEQTLIDIEAEYTTAAKEKGLL